MYLYAASTRVRRCEAGPETSAIARFISHNVFIKSFHESQFPQIFFNSVCTLVIVQNELTDLCGN